MPHIKSINISSRSGHRRRNHVACSGRRPGALQRAGTDLLRRRAPAGRLPSTAREHRPGGLSSGSHVFAVESEPSVDAWTGSRSMFVTEFDVDARRVLYRTNIGHGNPAAIALDPQGNVLVAGSTLPPGVPGHFVVYRRRDR